MIDLKGKTEEELSNFFVSIGEKPFRGKQMYQWIYYKKESTFSKMTDISKSLRDYLKEITFISNIKLLKRYISENKNTEKYLFELSDGNLIETALMRYGETPESARSTLCISTQVGCALKCSFCASGLKGLVRNLTHTEIIDQIIQVQKILIGERIANIVIMGIGEPLANYENLIKAVNMIKNSHGIGIGKRNIVISTAGLVPMIKKLACENTGCKLAISLHGYNNQIRSKLMPLNDRYPIEELLDACRYYQKITGDRITFEYILIKGLNDDLSGARKLTRMLKGLKCIVNLIPLNPVKHFPYEPSNILTCQCFVMEIEKYGINATLRTERGRSINAACGQLRARWDAKQET
ncbi:MAG TPA: 23S rRNA (adenine(2503)-C(2))-methyltransferase RlmN [Candidatus Eremiobacteraeota bacterium]|nr:MAG: putative dual-specificity RNA methyltransferase RlmN [bacterium ADurb.Bin363]HPZ09819.1 23S rRNA (adenine(2503)-C(2))-methyltransferase RlmN [Candidatus Eremiobacteraeota bacterium]